MPRPERKKTRNCELCGQPPGEQLLSDEDGKYFASGRRERLTLIRYSALDWLPPIEDMEDLQLWVCRRCLCGEDMTDEERQEILSGFVRSHMRHTCEIKDDERCTHLSAMNRHMKEIMEKHGIDTGKETRGAYLSKAVLRDRKERAVSHA